MFFVVFLPAVSFGIGWEVSQVMPANLPFWVETISPLGAFGLLYAFFERVAWRWPFFRWLGIVGVPDLNGRWVGEQLSSFKDKDGRPMRSRVVLEIEQSFSNVRTETYYHRWQTTHAAACFLQIEGQLYLVIIFESEPGARHDGPDTANKGVVRLRYLASDELIIGEYFNTSGSRGEVRFQRRSKKLLHRFQK